MYQFLFKLLSGNRIHIIIYRSCVTIIFSLIFLASCSKQDQHFLSENIQGDKLNLETNMTIELNHDGKFSTYLSFYNINTNKRLLINESFSKNGVLYGTTKSYVEIKNINTNQSFDISYQAAGILFSDDFINVKLHPGYISLEKGIYHIKIKIKNNDNIDYFNDIDTRIEFTERYRAK